MLDLLGTTLTDRLMVPEGRHLVVETSPLPAARAIREGRVVEPPSAGRGAHAGRAARQLILPARRPKAWAFPIVAAAAPSAPSSWWLETDPVEDVGREDFLLTIGRQVGQALARASRARCQLAAAALCGSSRRPASCWAARSTRGDDRPRRRGRRARVRRLVLGGAARSRRPAPVARRHPRGSGEGGRNGPHSARAVPARPRRPVRHRRGDPHRRTRAGAGDRAGADRGLRAGAPRPRRDDPRAPPGVLDDGAAGLARTDPRRHELRVRRIGAPLRGGRPRRGGRLARRAATAIDTTRGCSRIATGSRRPSRRACGRHRCRRSTASNWALSTGPPAPATRWRTSTTCSPVTGGTGSPWWATCAARAPRPPP